MQWTWQSDFVTFDGTLCHKWYRLTHGYCCPWIRKGSRVPSVPEKTNLILKEYSSYEQKHNDQQEQTGDHTQPRIGYSKSIESLLRGRNEIPVRRTPGATPQMAPSTATIPAMPKRIVVFCSNIRWLICLSFSSFGQRWMSLKHPPQVIDIEPQSLGQKLLSPDENHSFLRRNSIPIKPPPITLFEISTWMSHRCLCWFESFVNSLLESLSESTAEGAAQWLNVLQEKVFLGELEKHEVAAPFNLLIRQVKGKNEDKVLFRIA